MRKNIYFFLSVLSCCYSSFSYAELPLTVDDLMTDKNRFKLEMGLNYFNQTQKNIINSDFNIVDLGNGRSITIPNVSNEITNTDSYIFGMGLRYGVNDKLEAGVKTNLLSNHQRYQNLGQSFEKSYQQVQDVILTSQYQLFDNHKKMPNSLIFTEISLYDDTFGLEKKNFSSILLGNTIYTVNDPILLSLTTTYQYQSNRKIDSTNTMIDIGDILSINGLVGFAVNPDITLTTGVGWQIKQADKINDADIETKRTQTNLNLGLAYALSERTNLTTNIRTNISGEGGSTLSVGFSTKLGKLAEPISEKYKKLKKQEQ